MSYFKEVYDKLQSDIFEIWMYRKEVETLGKVMEPQEEIEFASAGSYGDHMGVWVATNQRLLVVCKEDQGMAVKGVPYTSIKSVMKDDYLDEQNMGAITIHFTDGDQLMISCIRENSIEKMMEEIKTRITEEQVYDIEKEVEFYLTEQETVLGHMESLYKGMMQFAYVTNEKWMIFVYGAVDGNHMMIGRLDETWLMENTIKTGEVKCHIYANDCVGQFYMAGENKQMDSFKQTLIRQMMMVKQAKVQKQNPEKQVENQPAAVVTDSFYESLTDIERAFLQLFKEEKKINHHFLFARSHGLMWSSFVDGINEKAIEYLNDMLFIEEEEYCVWQEDVYSNRG